MPEPDYTTRCGLCGEKVDEELIALHSNPDPVFNAAGQVVAVHICNVSIHDRLRKIELLVLALGLDSAFNWGNAGVDPDKYLFIENSSMEIELRALRKLVVGQ